MECTVDDVKEYLNCFKQLIAHSDKKTIFSIGGKSHYENPTTAILAFYLNPEEEHGFGDIILNRFLSVISEKIGIELEYSREYSIEFYREYRTKKNKKLDLVISTKRWTLAIENKIKHKAVNPFHEYEEQLKLDYKENCHKTILTPKSDPVDGWTSISYIDILIALKRSWETESEYIEKTKWTHFYEDFLINLELNSKEIDMDIATSTLLEKNLYNIYKLIEIKNGYLRSTAREITSKLNSLPKLDKFTGDYKERWSEGPHFEFAHKRIKSILLVIYTGHKDYTDYNIGILTTKSGSARLRGYIKRINKISEFEKKGIKHDKYDFNFVSHEPYDTIDKASKALSSIARIIF